MRFSSLFAAGDVSRETYPAAKSEEKRMFSQARKGPIVFIFLNNIISWGVFLYIFEIL